MAHRKSKRRKAKSGKRAQRRAQISARPSTRAIEAALAGIAHDIRTPLTGILALAELLATSSLGARERQWASAVRSGAEHLAALTTLIVDAAKIDAGGITLRREPFSPRKLAEAVGAALSARAETKGITAETTIAGDLPAMVSGDMLRLRAALENLTDNAVKFTGAGTVKFTATAAAAGRGRVRLVFTVKDSGIGINKEDIKQLFKPFAQASADIARRYGGAGLGLFFVKRVAEVMGGRLTLQSELGRGSTFSLSVPAPLVDATSLADPQAVQSVATRRLSVLCAEDNPYGRVVMNTILNELGHHADFVETGEAAVTAAARGGYDVVLMDIVLPGLDGIEATRRIRSLPGNVAQVPVIGFSGRSESGNETAARDAGMNFYFVKPVSPGRLAQALAAIGR